MRSQAEFEAGFEVARKENARLKAECARLSATKVKPMADALNKENASPNAPETKTCNTCFLPRAREAYGTKQWKARSVRRCAECATADRPVRAKAPAAVPVTQPAPARRDSALTRVEKEHDARLGDRAELALKLRSNVDLVAADAPEFVMPRVSAGSEPELRRLGRSLGLRLNAKHYFAQDNPENPDYGDVANLEAIAVDVSLAGVKFAFDRTFFGMTQCDMGTLDLLCCLRKGRPFAIFALGAGENSGCASEATPAQLEQLSRKLGLERAAPAELVATILAAVCPNLLAWPLCYNEQEGGYFEVSQKKTPMLKEAITLLEDPWRRRDSDKPGVPLSDDDDDASSEGPFHPTAPLHGFMAFMKEMRPHAEAEDPSRTYGQVGKRLGELWRGLPDVEKAKYDKRTKPEPEPEEAPATWLRVGAQVIDKLLNTNVRIVREGQDCWTVQLPCGKEVAREASDLKNLTSEQRGVFAAVARFQAHADNPESDPTFAQDYANKLVAIARRQLAAKKASDVPGGGGVDVVPEPRQEATEDPDSPEARLELSLARRRCDVCALQAAKAEPPFQVCNGCRDRRYCSRGFQRADWAFYKQYCAGYNADV